MFGMEPAWEQRRAKRDRQKQLSVLKLPPAVPVIMDRQAYPAQSAGRQARIQVVPRLIRPEYDYSGLFLFPDRHLRQSL